MPASPPHRLPSVPQFDRTARGLPVAALALVVLGLATIAGFRLYTGIVLEDGLITARYAANLAQGRGFVFNPGEPVLGTTTPLFTMVLAAAGVVGGVSAIPAIGLLFGMTAYAAAALLLHSGLGRLGLPAPARLAVLAAFLFQPDIVWSSVGGMETPIVVLAVVASWWLLVADRFVAGAVVAALLVLLRIDGVVWAGLAGLWMFWHDRRRAFVAAAVGAAVAAPWFLFAMLYFGSPVPHTMLAKRVIGGVLGPLSLRTLPAESGWFLRSLGAFTPGLSIAGVLAFVWGGVTIVRRHAAPLWAAAAFPGALAAALWVGRAPHFNWYLVPVVWGVLLTSVIGCWEMCEMAARRLPSLDAARRRASSGVAMAAVIGVVLVGYLNDGLELATFHRQFQLNEEGLRKQVGLWLRDHTEPDARVAMEAIGYQGYYSGRRVIDFAGLVSPEVVAIKTASRSNAEAFHTILERLHPDALVLRSFEVDTNRHFHGGELFETPAQRAFFEAQYHEAVRLDAPLPDFWGRLAHLTIYTRRAPRDGVARSERQTAP